MRIAALTVFAQQVVVGIDDPGGIGRFSQSLAHSLACPGSENVASVDGKHPGAPRLPQQRLQGGISAGGGKPGRDTLGRKAGQRCLLSGATANQRDDWRRIASRARLDSVRCGFLRHPQAIGAR